MNIIFRVDLISFISVLKSTVKIKYFNKCITNLLVSVWCVMVQWCMLRGAVRWVVLISLSSLEHWGSCGAGKLDPQCVSPQLLWLTPQAGHNVPHSKFLLQDNIIITTSLSDQNIGDAATLNSHHFTDKTEILYTILHLRQRYYRYVQSFNG